MSSKQEKLACESCIRGHRVAQCKHTDRPLLRVSRKGRPVSQCNHCRSLRNSRSVHTSCKCASTSRQAMLKQFDQERCDCCHGGMCKCAYKTDQSAKKGASSPASRDKSSTPSSTLSSPHFEQGSTEFIPAPLQLNKTEGSASCCHNSEALGAVSAPSITSSNDWPSDNILNSWATPSEGPLLDPWLQGTQDLIGAWDSVPSFGTNGQTHTTIPTFDDPLSTTDPFDLDALFNESDLGQLPILDSLNSFDLAATNYDDPHQWPNKP